MPNLKYLVEVIGVIRDSWVCREIADAAPPVTATTIELLGSD
jgi:hypothetical protein